MAKLTHSALGKLFKNSPTEPLEFISVSKHEPRRHKVLLAARQLGRAAAATVSNVSLGTMYTPDDINAHLAQYKQTSVVTAHHAKNVAADWRHTPWSTGDKYKKPVIGSLAWANLAFGESIALAAQGLVQAGDGSNAASFGTALGTALLVEVVFTAPIAWHNRHQSQPISSHRVARSIGTAFWLGGAWGVDQEKLPPKYAGLPIASYMIFGTGLAVVGEYNNFAEKLIESPIFLALLLAAGALKKVNDIFGYVGFFERMGEKTADWIERLIGSRKQIRNRDS